MNDFALDTNVLLYALDESNATKRAVSNALIDKKGLVCSQVLSEYMNVCLRKFKKSKFETIEYADFILSKSHFLGVSRSTIQLAFNLINKYQFQLFDAIIVASALEAGCTILYTEDMQKGLLIENSLKIVNPFL